MTMNENQYRIWRSPYSRFGGLNSLRPDDTTDETVTAVDCYTDDVLREIAENGFNAIWLHSVLANITHLDIFPEFGKHAELHIRNLSTLISRAAKYGIRVFLYFQPVRSVAAENREFWNRHSECAGQREKATEQVLDANKDQLIDMICLCTSVPAVKQWVADASAQLAEKLPELGGVILITASEYPGHCYSHRRKKDATPWTPLIECPRCREREPWEVAAELVNLVHDGIRRHSDRIELIAWNWGWSGWLPSPCRPLLELLPRDIILMAGCERGGRMDLAEHPGHKIDEYSLTYSGPSELCLGVLEVAGELGMRRMTKLQLGTTHELATVVNLPLMNSIYRKADWHRKHPDVGYMGCWNFGNMFSANTHGFNYFLRRERPDGKEEAMRAFAEDYFPGCRSELLLRAWDIFEKAMKHIPFAIPFLYNGVHSHALSYAEIYRAEPLRGTPAGCSYLPSLRGDDLSPSCTMPGHEYSLDEIISALGKMGVIWEIGAELMEEALASCPDDRKELGNAIVCGCLWRSAENAYRAYRLRKEWSDEKVHEMRRIILAELETLHKALPRVEKDPRLGYHGEPTCHMFNPVSIREKQDLLNSRLKHLNSNL